MAQDRLIRLAIGGGVLAGGAAAELVGASSLPAGLLDWAIGAAWVSAAVLPRRRRREVALGLSTAAAWFLATALTHAGGDVLLTIAYRGPLLHWVVDRSPVVRRQRFARILVAAGYLAALVGSTGSAVAGAAVAFVLAALLLASSRRIGPADLRRAAAGAAALTALLGTLWLCAALGVLGGTVLQVVTAVVLLGSALVLAGSDAGLPAAIGTMVLDLGPTSSQASPVSASLAAALADPGLRIRAYRPDLGWRDELGRPAADPGAAAATAIDTPGGGRVLLLHGPGGVPGSPLARAAVAAAALVLERVMVEAQVQREEGEVRRSASRLVTVNDAERQALAARLEAGPIARLDGVGRSLHRDDEPETLLAELREVVDELRGLAAGLGPARLSRGRLDEALQALAEAGPVAVALTLSGSFADLDDRDAALVYFVCAEALTNAVRHAGVGSADLDVHAGDATLAIEVRDAGRGGASLGAGHGLQGLADRIALAGGTLTIDSPPGGPTVLRATTPRGGPR